MSKTFGDSLRNAVLALGNIGRWISMISLGLMTLITTADVCGRYIFKSTVVGAQDITELMLVLVVFASLSYTSSIDGHIRVEAVTSILPERLRVIFRVITSFLGVITFAVVSWCLWLKAWSSLNQSELTQIIEFPIGPFRALAAICCALLATELLTDSFDHLFKLKTIRFQKKKDRKKQNNY